MKIEKALEAAADAIAEIIGPPVGNPEYLAKHADRLRERNRQTCLNFADAAITAYLSAIEGAGFVVVDRERLAAVWRILDNEAHSESDELFAMLAAKDAT